ncbi:LLM class flavin-dependent oxidoreductase [Microcoleus sp. AR_TQ3_B6]|uniref:MupA/Atu3671 family FMN-dependent luciferase-like monooxygenase n=1 Tax=Microcoleus sp. AR_TQ3_B6 TaxID=3055284 RepID=UPI002FD4FE88
MVTTQNLACDRSFNIDNVVTLVDILQSKALYQPDKKAFTFLLDGETEESSLTYLELELQARAIATRLQDLGASGERALLIYPPGLEFIAAFFGCLYAGVVAVPAYPPRRNQSLSRLQSIVADAGATIALTTKTVLSNVERLFTQSPTLQALHWLPTDNIASDLAQAWLQPAISSDTLAFLQYTSGSTGRPKGVMVTHGNLLHNEQMIQTGFEHTEKTIYVSWLPLFHDMGLIGNMLQSLYLGRPCILMSPVAFLQRPVRWLQAISRYKATTSGAPNFAYELCLNKITNEQRETLDLSSWDVAFNGAEPVRAETLERFATAFEPCGFRREAFYPCYGMAEATLMISGGIKAARPVLKTVEGEALEQHRVVSASGKNDEVRTLVGCGQTLLEQQIVIVHPDTLTRCQPHEVGEIWVWGNSVAQGYWNRPEETQATFQAYLADTGEGPFLRTGDLGFLQEGELFVTGRLKDLIIIRGRNHYPQDIELTVEKSHPVVQLGCTAAFSVEVNAQERLVVACEVERTSRRNLDVDEIVGAIRKAVSQQHDLEVYGVLLLKTGTIPKTSSGKIQRHACKAGFIAESLSVLGSSILSHIDDLIEAPTLTQETLHPTPETQRQLLLELDLRNQLARLLGISPSQLNPQQPLNTFGVDSLKAVEIKNQIEANFGFVLPIETFLDDINITELATQILSGATSSSPTPSSISAPIQTTTEFPGLKQQRVSQSIAQPQRPATKNNLEFSLFYFSSEEAEFTDDKYRLLIEGAKFADRHDFAAVWIPERHFHAFGGIYPNPSVLGAAVAMVTERVRLRAGSVVLPLQNPIRVAEEWSVVDNLSKGRVDLAFARGWNPNDFVLSPETYANRTEALFSGMQTVQKLWRGESISLPNGIGKETEIKVYPLPKQRELSVWMTCSGGKERFIEAGALGVNILTALLFQPIEELAEKIALYRDSRAKHGHDPEAGHVTLMLHTFVGEDIEVVRNQVREPFIEYLKNSVDLWRQDSKNLDDLTEKEREDLLAYAFERYFQTSALFGTPDTCLTKVARLKEIGVNEIACLIDFGVDVDAVMAALYSLTKLKEDSNANVNSAESDDNQPPDRATISNKIDLQNPEQLLSQLYQLSEKEVDSLLSKLLINNPR